MICARLKLIEAKNLDCLHTIIVNEPFISQTTATFFKCCCKIIAIQESNMKNGVSRRMDITVIKILFMDYYIFAFKIYPFGFFSLISRMIYIYIYIYIIEERIHINRSGWRVIIVAHTDTAASVVN